MMAPTFEAYAGAGVSTTILLPKASRCCVVARIFRAEDTLLARVVTVGILSFLLLAATQPALLGSVARGADSEFVETFNGAPGQPIAWSSPRWDVIVHDRTDGATNAMEADHDHSCGAPPATHTLHGAGEAVFLCRDHVMTALNSSDPGYAVIYLTPAAMADWSDGPAEISFDVSTARSTKRDWIDLWLTPWEQAMVLPSEPHTPDLSGPPQKALHFRVNNEFAWQIYRFPEEVKLSHNDWRDVPVPYSRAQRDTFRFTIGGGFITITYTNVVTGKTLQVERVPLPRDLGYSRAVVQIGHHSYTPSKDCDFMTIGSCGPNTWHWDNVKISPALPFDMAKLGRLTEPGTVPVSPGLLRFAARGETEIDWGKGWQPVQPVNRPIANTGQFASYSLPVPHGAVRAAIRGKGSWAGPWRAENIAIWSLGTAAGSAPAPQAAPAPPPASAPGGPGAPPEPSPWR